LTEPLSKICPTGDKDKAIVQSVIDLAKGLELWVVAEGAETNLQVKQLWEMGCDIIQGYFYYKPMPLGAIQRAALDCPEERKRQLIFSLAAL
jgi:EAL domain-containing protein (putative c-di-GMP-specific phosphodiesterase class I)